MRIPLNWSKMNERALVGEQALLVFTSVPAGAEALVGAQVLGAQITIAGTYTCSIDMAGLSTKIEVHLTATNNSGTMPTTSGGSTYYDQSTLKTAFTGVGLMVTATRQTLSLAAANLLGEREADIIITLPAASSCTFTQAEYNGI